MPPAQPDDNATSLTMIGSLVAARDGDPTWAAKVDSRYGKLICYYAREKGAGLAEQKEIKQAVLLELFRKLPKGEFLHSGQTGSFRAFLKQITQWRTIDLIRKSANSKLSSSEPLGAELIDWKAKRPEETLQADDLRALLQQALAILLNESKGDDDKHIAALLIETRASDIAKRLMAAGKSRNAADVALSRTRDKLRDILTQRLGYEFPPGLAKATARRPRKDS